MQLPPISTLALLALTSFVTANPNPHYDHRDLYTRNADAYANADAESYYSAFDLYARNAAAYAEAEPYPDPYYDQRALYARDAHSDNDLFPRDASIPLSARDPGFFSSKISGWCYNRGYKTMSCEDGKGGVIWNRARPCEQPGVKAGAPCDSG